MSNSIATAKFIVNELEITKLGGGVGIIPHPPHTVVLLAHNE